MSKQEHRSAVLAALFYFVFVLKNLQMCRFINVSFELSDLLNLFKPVCSKKKKKVFYKPFCQT